MFNSFVSLPEVVTMYSSLCEVVPPFLKKNCIARVPTSNRTIQRYHARHIRQSNVARRVQSLSTQKCMTKLVPKVLNSRDLTCSVKMSEAYNIANCSFMSIFMAWQICVHVYIYICIWYMYVCVSISPKDGFKRV